MSRSHKLSRLTVQRVGQFWHGLSQALSSKRAQKIYLISLGVVIGLFVLVQVFYPRDRALPLSQLAGNSIAGWTSGDIGKFASELYDKSTIEVANGDKVMLARRASGVGVMIKQQELVKSATNYPWWLRIVPTSMFWASKHLDYFDATTDGSQLTKFLDANKDNLNIVPENAKISNEAGKLSIIKEVDGARLSVDEYRKGLSVAKFRLGGATRLGVRFSLERPPITAGDLESVAQRAEEIARRPLALVFEDLRGEVEPQTIKDWLIFGQDEAKTAADIKILLDHSKIAEYAKGHFEKKVTIAPGVTELYLTDGIETSQKPGPEGRAINETALISEIESRLLSGEPAQKEVTVPAKSVPARINKHHTFTKSQTGLQAYLSSLADDGDVKVSVTQIDGRRWSASYRGDDQMTAASTYKVYVAAFVLDKITKNELSYDDQINGISYRECLDRMIVKSDNACPEAVIEKFGRSNINDFFYGRGYSRAMSFTNSNSAQTSANDLIRAMIEIDNSQLVNGSERDFLLGLMKRQVYRQGIPAGTGSVVAGKVGFLGGVLNDTGIVYHPSGKYAISVMTNGLSWAKIAEITKKIESIMY